MSLFLQIYKLAKITIVKPAQKACTYVEPCTLLNSVVIRMNDLMC